MTFRSGLASAVLVLCFAGLARADVVHLTSGGIVRGEIVQETPRELVVRTFGGTTVIPRHEIDRVERGASPEQVYQERLAAIDPADAEARYALGLWLKSIRATHLARREFEVTVELDPDHAFARAELGFTQVGGAWVRERASTAAPATAATGAARAREQRLATAVSPALDAALTAMRDEDPDVRREAWKVLADEAGEVERILAALAGADAADRNGEAARLGAALARHVPAAAEANASADALRPHVAAYVRGAVRPAVNEAVLAQARRVERSYDRVAKRAAGLIRDYRKDRETSAMEQRTTTLTRWVAERDAAVRVIFDTSVYRDEDKGRSGQPTVDEHVDRVRALWTVLDAMVQRDLARILGMPVEEAERAVRAIEGPRAALDEADAFLAARGAEPLAVPALDPVYEVLLTYRAGGHAAAIARKAGLDPWEQNLLQRLQDERVREHNASFRVRNPLPYGVKPAGDEVEQVRITNDYRIMMGRLPLEIDPRLVDAARGHSADMTRLGFFAHESPIGEKRTPSMRMARAGYPGVGGENISLGSEAPLATHIAWYNSAGHHRNILSPSWRCMGAGKDGRHWTQKFGSEVALER